MKKLFTTLMVCSVAYFSISQDNTLPTSGNVGLGTLTPTEKLTVNGSVSIQDSLKVNKTIRVMDKVFIGGKTVMSDDAVAKQNFKVIGNTNMDGNATVDGALRLPNTDSLSNNNIANGNFDFLLLNENGVAKKGSIEGIAERLGPIIYTPYIPNGLPSICDLAGYNPMWYNGTNKIYTGCSDVNVGIRTETPRTALDVRGTTFTEFLAVGVEPDQVNARVHIKLQTSNPNSTAKALIIENLNRKLLTLDNSGLLKAREIKVDAQAWPDYVFKPNYELMPLSEVETYIKKEGHLPEFPSAQEVEENGMDVYETNKLLVQKIEELTLHLIEQEKQLKEQNQRIAELENKK